MARTFLYFHTGWTVSAGCSFWIHAKIRRPDSTHSRFSSSTPPPPLAWACCLIYPWSSALLHTSKSTLARSTCYYLLSSLLLCQKHTQTQASSVQWHQQNERSTLMFRFGGKNKESNSSSSEVSLSLCVVHSSCSHDLLTHQLWHSRQASQTPGALWRRAGGSSGSLT